MPFFILSFELKFVDAIINVADGTVHPLEAMLSADNADSTL